MNAKLDERADYKWEHKIKHVESLYAPDLERVLSDYERYGWQLVTILEERMLVVFKRPLLEKDS